MTQPNDEKFLRSELLSFDPLNGGCNRNRRRREREVIPRSQKKKKKIEEDKGKKKFRNRCFVRIDLSDKQTQRRQENAFKGENYFFGGTHLPELLLDGKQLQAQMFHRFFSQTYRNRFP